MAVGQFAVKLTDPEDGRPYYLHWSTIVDSPVYVALSLDEYKAYVRERRGADGLEGCERRGDFDRLEATGLSAKFWPASVEDALAGNRAGPREECLSAEGILDRYCRGRAESGPC
jgi:hypothetical protein